MNETLDATTVADEFCAAGIDPALTARLADAVLVAGAAAVPALGPSAFADWATRADVNGMIGRAFDAGADRAALAADLELVALLQSVTLLEAA